MQLDVHMHCTSTVMKSELFLGVSFAHFGCISVRATLHVFLPQCKPPHYITIMELGAEHSANWLTVRGVHGYSGTRATREELG